MPWRPYEHGPLDAVYIARSSAQTDVNQLTGRLQHTLWRDRRSVPRQLDAATSRAEQADSAYQDRYRHERDRLDPLTAGVQDRLEHTPRPERPTRSRGPELGL